MDTILVVNAGSSSVKFQIFTVEGEGRLQRQIKGQMDGIGSRPQLRANGPTGDPLADRAYPIEAVADVPAAMAVAGAWLRDELNINPMAVGHRVVHGGPDYAHPVLIDHAVVTRLERYKKEWGQLDFLLHSIAFSPKGALHGRVVDVDREGFLKTMDVSCWSFVRMAHLAEPLMKNGGTMFTMTYYGSQIVVKNYNIMGVAKAALEAAVR